MKRNINKKTAAESRRISEILESITDAFFALDQQWRFTYLNDQAEKLLQRQRHELLGKNIWDEFSDAVGSLFYTEYHRAVQDGVSVSFNDYYPALDLWFEVRAYPSKDGISVYFHDISSRKKLEAEREDLLAVTQTRAEREELLNKLGQIIRSTSDLETIQSSAAALLGQALNVDRCYYATYDLEKELVIVAPDWHTAELTSAQGIHKFTNTAAMFEELYGGSNTSVIPDVSTTDLSEQTKLNMKQINIGSRLSVALVADSGLMATLSASTVQGPRKWTEQDISLMESVATQLKSGAESLRAQQREHRIAVQLQQALQPDLPGVVPGLSVVRYYEAALIDEAGVGGDFYDVFAIDKGCTALVVGDLSGKGLAAATQVSVCRSMLRAFLYTQPSLRQAVSSLNEVLMQHHLLSGFTTLFAGTYESGSRELRYVNCGQEPALVRRADGGPILYLGPTGPVLGMSEGAVYTEEVITLSVDDALAVFSDGLTEVGASRLEMLGIDGLAQVFNDRVEKLSQIPAEAAAELSDRMVSKVVSMSVDGVRDDMCLLVAVIK